MQHNQLRPLLSRMPHTVIVSLPFARSVSGCFTHKPRVHVPLQPWAKSSAHGTQLRVSLVGLRWL